MSDRNMTAKEAAAELGVHEKTLRNWARQYGCPADDTPAGWRFDVDEVRDWQEVSGIDGTIGRPDYVRMDRVAEARRRQEEGATLGLESPERVKIANAPGGFFLAAETAPEPIALPFEREVLRGERVLTTDEVRAVIACAIWARHLACIDFPTRTPREVETSALVTARTMRARLTTVFGRKLTGDDEEGLDETPLLEDLREYDRLRRKGKTSRGRKH